MSEEKRQTGQIFELMPRLMADMGVITKNRKNDFQKYMFRGIDDVYAALQPLLIKHGITLVPKYAPATSEQLSKGFHVTTLLILEWVAPDGSFIRTAFPGEGVDSGDKALYKAMAGAFKYAVFQTLCVPTEGSPDAEIDSPIARPAGAAKTIADRLRAAKSVAELKKVAADVDEGFSDSDRKMLNGVYEEMTNALSKRK